MKNCLFFAITVFGFIMQACGDNPKERSNIEDRGSFANDPNTIIKSESGKHFCDFQWTIGFKNWDYGSYEDINVDTVQAIAPWCLIPDSSSTNFLVYFNNFNNGDSHYICRNENSSARIMNEDGLPIISIEYNDSLYRNMKCVVPINNKITVGTNNDNEKLGTDFLDDKIYHIIENEGFYRIVGHLNIKYVKPIRLKVLFEVFRNDGIVKDIYYDVKNDEEKIKQFWKDYMAKAGYTLEIRTTYVPFPNTWDSNFLTDSMITIPSNGNYADELYKINKYLGTNNYDYVIGVTPGSTHNRAGKKEVFSLDYNNGYANGFVLTDFDFFNTSAEEKARMLTSLLYSKILGKDPLKNQNDLYLSYYTTNLDFSQPSKDWETRLSKSVPRVQMEFALH